MRGHYYELPSPNWHWSRSEVLATLRDDYQHLHLKLSTFDTQELSDLLKRLQAGLPTYHNDTISQLQKRFPLGQGYPFYDRKRERYHRHRGQLLALLDEDLLEHTFDRFLDLPPEIRQRIYGFAFSYSDNAYHIQQPAIARVCRITRMESLPIFYKINRFGIAVKRNGSKPTRQALVDHWPTFISEEHIGMMRYFEVKLENTDFKTYVRIKIDLPSLRGDEPLKIRAWSLALERNDKHLASCLPLFERHLRPVIEKHLSKPGLGNFSTREVLQMVLSIQKAVDVPGGRI
ncbi:hypothetical protein LTR81_019774 [Elasticomyces elasticus]